MFGESTSGNTESPGPPQVLTLNESQIQEKIKVCKFFVKNQTCQFGKKCRFLHPEESYPVYVQRSFDIENEAVSEEDTPITRKPKVYVPPHRLRPRIHHEAVKVRATEEEPLPINQNTFGQVCKYFSRNGFCKNGDNCKYFHDQDHGTDDIIETELRKRLNYGGRGGGGRGRAGRRQGFNQSGMGIADTGERQGVKPIRSYKQQNSRQLCRYFKGGDCRFGDQCKFWHPSDLPEIPVGYFDEVELAEQFGALSGAVKKGEVEVSEPQKQRAVVQPTAEFSIETLTDEDVAKHRVTEVNLLMKRFPRAEITVLPRRKEEAYKIVFTPTDPDWPYDVKEIQMTILFPETYPREGMIVKLSKDQPLPDTVRRYLYSSITDWLNKRYERLIQRMRVELVFRPFIRWLDKNAEDLFTGGLKQYQRELMARAAGIEIVTASELREKYEVESEDDDDSQEDDDDDDTEEYAEYSDENEEQCEDDDDEYQTASDEESRTENPASDQKSSVDPVKKGTEIKLHNLQLKDGAVTLMALKLHLIIQCGRCKNKDEIKVRHNQGVSLICGKCSNACIVAFRPAIVHQFSAILGYLDVKECHAFDLILTDSEFMIGCEKCNKEMKIQGLAPGLPRDMWCQFCHQKLKVIVETTRFLVLQPNEFAGSGNSVEVVSRKKIAKAVKDPAIKEGFPLPDQGTCRHYKKSYRWLRFPCCGKAYPCDVCHDEKESHHMVYANRMICGFCCKEQRYAKEKPCSGCDASMIKKATTHWEGGKGCRDKISMSRSDDKKYTNTNKTISRRAAQQKHSGKKITKLRHT